MKTVLTTLILCLVLTSLSFSQWRETTAEERTWDKKVITEFEKILTSAAQKMTQPWKYSFNPGYEGRREIDAINYIPHELRCSLLLDFPSESEEAQKLELEANQYAAKTDSLAAIGQQNTLENPWDRTEIFVDVVVNYGALAFEALDTMKLSSNEKIIHLPGAVLSIYQAYPGSSDRPTTRCWFGDIPFKNNPSSIPNYSPSRHINRTDVKNVILTIHTASTLAQEFYHNLDVPAIQRIISDM